jgi:hypothetical protein
MRCRALAVAAILMGAASVPAAAQIELDMNKITCGDWLGYAPADRDFVRYFMRGYSADSSATCRVASKE